MSVQEGPQAEKQQCCVPRTYSWPVPCLHPASVLAPHRIPGLSPVSWCSPGLGTLFSDILKAILRKTVIWGSQAQKRTNRWRHRRVDSTRVRLCSQPFLSGAGACRLGRRGTCCFRRNVDDIQKGGVSDDCECQNYMTQRTHGSRGGVRGLRHRTQQPRAWALKSKWKEVQITALSLSGPLVELDGMRLSFHISKLDYDHDLTGLL